MNLLLIEDNIDLVGNLSDFLELRGHCVNIAYDARAGLDMALCSCHDVIILDIMLPGGTGIAVCEQLRERGHGEPVLFLSVRDDLDSKIAGFRSGGDDYLVKPFELPELAIRLEALHRRDKGRACNAPVVVADLSFDPVKQQFTRNEVDLCLPKIPRRILEILIRQSPRVVPRSEIEWEIWGEDPPSADALRAHIHTLRRIVDRPFDVALLRTIHGVGFQVRPPDPET